MKIGLIDVDSHNFPNLALMKISAYHKERGDSVEFWDSYARYDLVYKSRIFCNSTDWDYDTHADETIKGGTGYGLDNHLLPEIEKHCPDYSLYPHFNEAIGFTTRGCPRQCEFCCVSAKEGCKSVQTADLSEFWRGQKVICSMDSNLLACKDRERILQQYIDSKAYIDFQSGLDIRFVNDGIAKMIAKLNVRMIHFAWDNPNDDLTAQFMKFRKQSTIDERNLTVYVLTNYWSTHEQDLCRIYKLREMGYTPFVMVYDKDNADQQHKDVARWVDNRFIFRSCEHFEDYKKYVKENPNQIKLY